MVPVCIYIHIVELGGLRRIIKVLVYIIGSTGNAGPRLFTIHQVDANTDNLPKAHTWYDLKKIT